MNEPGLLEFSQFELINKVAFDTDTNQFSLLEPGVYLLQMSGSIEGGSLIAKLVSDDVAVDFMILEAGKNGSFKSRSTIFTIEDDDQTAENLLVELVTHDDGTVRLDSDFSFLMYKISEVSNVDHLCRIVLGGHPQDPRPGAPKLLRMTLLEMAELRSVVSYGSSLLW